MNIEIFLFLFFLNHLTATKQTQGPPRIIDMQVVRLVSKNNDKIFITCNVSGSRPMHVSWFMYKDDVKTFRLKKVAKTMNELEIAAAGVYECQVENRRGTFSKVITVSPQEIEKLVALKQKVESKSESSSVFLYHLFAKVMYLINIYFVLVYTTQVNNTFRAR